MFWEKCFLTLPYVSFLCSFISQPLGTSMIVAVTSAKTVAKGASGAYISEEGGLSTVGYRSCGPKEAKQIFIHCFLSSYHLSVEMTAGARRALQNAVHKAPMF